MNVNTYLLKLEKGMLKLIPFPKTKKKKSKEKKK